MTQMRTEEMRNMAPAPVTVPSEMLQDFVDQDGNVRASAQGYNQIEEVTLKISEGWVGNRFTSKSGKELVEVKIPNANREDKSPWPSFVTDPKRLHKNKFGTGLWMKIPKNAHTTLKRPMRIGTDPSGKGIYENRMDSIPNTELKSMIDAARRSARNESRAADEHVRQVSEMAAAHQEDLPDFLREPARTR